ncbi:MAG: major capsid protein [Actinomycetia bacterium]|nr:major capsid protein [Actinomycetes bacterium]
MQIINLVPDLRPVILAARQMRDDRNSLSRFLPNVNVQAVSYRLGRRRRLDQTVPVRAFDAPATPIKRPGLLDVQGELPAITPIIDLSEQDLNNEMILAQQLAGMQVDWQPWVTSAAGQAALTVDNTLEQMRGQLLSTGKVTLTAEDGATHEVDFEVPADNIITAAAVWDYTDPAAVFADYAAAAVQFLDASGSEPGVALTTAKIRILLVNAVQQLFPNAPVGNTELNAYLANRNLPQVATYDRKLVGDDGTKSSVYPDGMITFLPSNDAPVGRTELGVTQESVQQVQNRVLTSTEAPGLTVVTLGQDNPVQRAVKGAAIGLPILRDNDDIVILKGLS